MANVSYPKDMRAIAKELNKELVTIAFPGIVYQFPVSDEELKELWDWFNPWLERRLAKANEDSK